MFYYLEIFQEIGDKQNGKQFEFILVHFFVFFKLCICMLCVETMNMVPWMTTKWNAMHVCAS